MELFFLVVTIAILLYPFFALSDFIVDSIQKFKKQKYISHKEKLKNNNNFIEEKSEERSPQEKYRYEFGRFISPLSGTIRQNDFMEKTQKIIKGLENNIIKARQKLLEEQAKLNALRFENIKRNMG